MKLKVKKLARDASRETYFHYTDSGLNNYWLGPGLFEMNDAGDLRLLEFDNIQATIGMHICNLPRRLGPREVRFLRGEIGVSQSELGAMLGYKDKQRVLAAEKLDAEGVSLAVGADMLLRLHYLNMLGRHNLVGDSYQQQALDMALQLQQSEQEAEADDHLLAA
jgi:hypothetical protein